MTSGTGKENNHAEKLIRDAKDQPILNAAIISDVDVILTGDKDFLSLDLEHPKCLTAAQSHPFSSRNRSMPRATPSS